MNTMFLKNNKILRKNNQKNKLKIYRMIYKNYQQKITHTLNKLRPFKDNSSNHK